MNPFRFIHAADLHLGSPFKGLADAPEHVRRGLAEAEYAALRRLTEAALELGADFAVFSGDLFDSADRSLRARAALHRAWSRLAGAGVRVFAIHGNHDPLGGGPAMFEWPEGVHVFGADDRAEHRPACRRDGKPAAFVYGISYDRRAVTENLVPRYRPAEGADFHIALLHANVDGDPDHDAYAPCRLSELTGAGFQYWALGHVHGRRVLHEYPHVVYPGNLQGRHPGETGAKGCYLVEVDASGGVRLTFLPLDGVRWLSCRVSIDGLEDEERLLERMEECAVRTASSADGRPVMLEVVLEGRGPLHRRLEDRADELLAALRDRLDGLAAGGGWSGVPAFDGDDVGRNGGSGGEREGESDGNGARGADGVFGADGPSGADGGRGGESDGYGARDGDGVFGAGGPSGAYGGWIWVHRLTIRTAPGLDLDRLAEEDSFAGEVLRLARRLAADPEGREALLREALGPMLRNPRLRRLIESRGLLSADGLLERAATRLAGMLERGEG
ncbi:DNA repair exonuclease [Thermobacillus sp. ZCTH02-B1]|uniref:DNA repair exonuclease n=1 Tax=Thermobacillus sp. ZCTH02-B1 TaxID=1858795 RepID=UPI0025DFDF87|nr:DNA repair exonuclease [Thermobacillus sp. ZCTH02-B1]